jgi:RNA polymerase sigma-70 factor, ECF subfamily
MQQDNLENQEDILRLCIQGNSLAWASLVRAYAPLVYSVIKQKAACSSDVIARDEIEDVFQQTFVNIWRRKSLDKIKNARSIPAYLAVIAQNTYLDFLRQRIRHNRLHDKYIDNSPLIDERNPMQQSHDRHMEEVATKLIKDMPFKEQRIITLNILYGLTHSQIAKLMDMPVSTISCVAARVKKSIKQKLKEQGYEY